MTNDKQVAIRLPKDTVARAARLARRLKDRPEYQPFRLSTSSVLRLAILKGLAALEQEAGR
jgi:hypothetical protein